MPTEPTIKAPFGAIDRKTLTAVSNVFSYTPKNSDTELTLAAQSGNATINITIDAELVDGAKLKINSIGTSTETLTYGAGINAPVVTNAAGKTKCQSFTYNSLTGVFEADGAVVQID